MFLTVGLVALAPALPQAAAMAPDVTSSLVTANTPELAPAGRCIGAADPAGRAFAQQASMRCLVNFARHADALSALSASATLGRSASHKNSLMLSCDDFAHDACGLPWGQVFLQAGYASSYGENIGWARAALGSPRQVMAMWLGSPEHRANILGASWTEQAVSVRVSVDFQGASDVNVWTSQFGAGAPAASAEGPPRAGP